MLHRYPKANDLVSAFLSESSTEKTALTSIWESDLRPRLLQAAGNLMDQSWAEISMRKEVVILSSVFKQVLALKKVETAEGICQKIKKTDVTFSNRLRTAHLMNLLGGSSTRALHLLPWTQAMHVKLPCPLTRMASRRSTTRRSTIRRSTISRSTIKIACVLLCTTWNQVNCWERVLP